VLYENWHKYGKISKTAWQPAYFRGNHPVSKV